LYHKCSREGSPTDLIGQIPLRFVDADRRQLFRKVSIAQPSSFQLALQKVLAHKMREAMASEIKGARLCGEGKIVEVDGDYFGGYVKPSNYAEQRVDRRLAENQSGKRKVVVAIRERDGRTIPAIFKTDAASLAFIRSRVEKGITIQADEATSWDDLYARFPMKHINHEEAYSHDDACRNGAEEFFSRMRRAEVGHHHHLAGAYLGRYAQENGLARRSPSHQQRRSGPDRVRSRGPQQDVCGFLWLLTEI
jgi:hypothetical protein